MESETAYAKINLALHVRRRRDDGYHELETLFAFARDGDRLSVAPSDGLSLEVSGPFAPALEGEGDNLVLAAARRLQALTGTRHGVALTLDKRLPVAAGLGGGSADAAAAIRLLVRHWCLDVTFGQLIELASELGADVPACLESATARGTARGDLLEPVAGVALAGMPLLIANPGLALATGPVFAGWDGVDHGPLGGGEALDAAKAGRNDLTASAIRLVPEIAGLLALLEAQPGVVLARMSGSGASCFALFGNEAGRDAARVAVEAALPRVWCLATALR